MLSSRVGLAGDIKAYVPVAKALYAKAKGDKSQFEVIILRRAGRYTELQQAKVEVAGR